MVRRSTRAPATRRLILSSILFAATAASATAQLTIPGNSKYFTYNGTPVALVGISGEYLPHVTRTTQQNNYATLESYPTYLNDISSRGLNKIRIWADVNHSIGFLDHGAAGPPYADEQPFFWNGSRWNLGRPDGQFYTNLENVIAYAATKNVFCEVTLFDAWQGDYTTSPWYPSGRNLWYDAGGTIHHDAGFTQRGYLVSYESVNQDIDQRNKDTRALQIQYVQKIVQALNAYTNFYWEISNEPDFNTVNGPIDITAMVNWHNSMAQLIVSTEAPLANKHAIAVNFITQAAMEQVRSGRLDPSIQAVNGHYVDISLKNSIPPRYGAISMSHAYNGTSTPINKLFGFNETQISPSPNDRLSSRAEAWEFMTSQGGLYDNLGYSWNTPAETAKPCSDPTLSSASVFVRCDLGRLTSFLTPLSLGNMTREVGLRPSWITAGVGNYGAFDSVAGTNTYWGAMEWVGQQYAFYFHHSTLSAGAGAKWYVPVTGSYARSFTFNLSGAANYFKIEWFYYAPGSPNVQSKRVDSVFWNGTPIVKTSPTYNYDLGIRVSRCPTSSPCS